MILTNLNLLMWNVHDKDGYKFDHAKKKKKAGSGELKINNKKGHAHKYMQQFKAVQNTTYFDLILLFYFSLFLLKEKKRKLY